MNMTGNIRVCSEGSSHCTRDDLFIFFQVRNRSERKTPVSYLYKGQSQSCTKKSRHERVPRNECLRSDMRTSIKGESGGEHTEEVLSCSRRPEPMEESGGHV
jgi:hypothetical protein